MAKVRRKKGIFDPDYRSSEWRGTAFAPSKSSLSITQLSLLITALLFVCMFTSPTAPQSLKTTNGIIGAGIVFFFIWLGLAFTMRRFTRRRVRPVPTPTFEFDETETRPEKAKAPVDPIQAQLTQRRARLQGDGSMTAQQFEHEVAHLLNALTPYKAVQVGGAGDGGVDVKVYKDGRLIGIVQCKFYNPDGALAPSHVRELYAVKQQFGVKTAYLVTTARFSRDTQQEAQRLGIKLIDGAEFQEMRKKARMKVRQEDERLAK